MEMLQSGPDSGVFEGMKGVGARGERKQSGQHALWALELGKGSHLISVHVGCGEAGPGTTAGTQVRRGCGLDRMGEERAGCGESQNQQIP